MEYFRRNFFQNLGVEDNTYGKTYADLDQTLNKYIRCNPMLATQVFIHRRYNYVDLLQI